MKLHDKLLKLRKEKGMTQEELAEQLNVSRQAVSRWEMGTALPDTENVLQLSKLYAVSIDYLLHDDYESDKDLPIVKRTKMETEEKLHRRFSFMSSCLSELIICFGMFHSVVRGSQTWLLIDIVLSIVQLFLYEYSNYVCDIRYRSGGYNLYRKRYHILWMWLVTYFPLRYAALLISDTKILPIKFEVCLVVLYLLIASIATYLIQKFYKMSNDK